MSTTQDQDITYTISVLLFGRSLIKDQEDDDPCHVGIAIHSNVANPKTCKLHHARCPDQVRFIYEHRPEQPYCTDPVLRGRCELRGDLEKADADRANKLLALYGAEQSHLPFFGQGNCQNWMAGAIEMLEQQGLAQSKDVQYWTEAIGKGRQTMEEGWKARGRHWVDNPRSLEPAPQLVDARWRDKEERVVGKLTEDETVSTRAEAIENLLQSRLAADTLFLGFGKKWHCVLQYSSNLCYL